VKLARLVKLIVWGLTGAAVVQELRTPSDKRTWHGTVGGVVPYDFRPPSPAKVRRAWWDPEGPLVTPMAFGVGWAINFARLLQLLNPKTS
jgi:Family of unknown function (DUF5808)